MTAADRYARAIGRASAIVRRLEREGLAGRNVVSSQHAARSYLLEAQAIAARELPASSSRAERFGRLLERAEDVGVEL